jgi:GNAT superfamily N-acetyltransferase
MPRPGDPESCQIVVRGARPAERAALESLQRRSSDVWEDYREQLAAHPDAIELPEELVLGGRVRVVTGDDDVPLGFSVTLPLGDGVHELDGLFVEPAHMQRGLGRVLVEDACERARAAGARRVEVIAGPAQGFYEKVGFVVVAAAETRFGPAVRMRRSL